MINWRILQLDPGQEQNLGFAKRAVTREIGLLDEARKSLVGSAIQNSGWGDFSRTWNVENAVIRARMSYYALIGWVAKLWISGGVSGGIMLLYAPFSIPVKRLLFLRDAGKPAWPQFMAQTTSAPSSTFVAWRYTDARRYTDPPNAPTFGTDSGTVSTSTDGFSHFDNWPMGGNGYVYFGLSGNGTHGISTGDLVGVPFATIPSYVAAYAAYVAYWTANEASLGTPQIRALMPDGRELAKAPIDSAGLVNVDKENWSGGGYLQLYNFVEDGVSTPLKDTANEWPKGDRLLFDVPGDAQVPTEEFGWNSTYATPAHGIRYVFDTDALSGNQTGKFAVRVGFEQYIDKPFSRTSNNGVTTYVNYPWNVVGTKFTVLANGDNIDGIGLTSVASYAESNGLSPGGDDPWPMERAEWDAAREAAPLQHERARALLESDVYLTSLAGTLLPDALRVLLRFRPLASKYYKASGDPLLAVSSGSVVDGTSATYSKTLSFSYTHKVDGIDILVTKTMSGTRTDTETTHVLKNVVGTTICTVVVIRQVFSNWCNVRPSGSGAGIPAGGQTFEPGVGVAAVTLDIGMLSTFAVDGSDDSEPDPLFAVVDGVRYLIKSINGALLTPFTEIGNSAGTFDVPMPYPSIIVERHLQADLIPHAFRDMPPLVVTPWDAYVEYRSRCRPVVVSRDTIEVTIEDETLIIPDYSFLDTRPSKDSIFKVYVATTEHPTLGDLGVFPVSDDQEERGCVMTLIHVYEFAYTYNTGSVIFVRDALPEPYVFPAYPPGVRGLVCVVAGEAPPTDVGRNFFVAKRDAIIGYDADEEAATPSVPYMDPTVKKRDANGVPTEFYTHLSDYLEAPNTDEAGYREWVVQAWFFRQLLQF